MKKNRQFTSKLSLYIKINNFHTVSRQRAEFLILSFQFASDNREEI